jgi:hypothetical protein
MGKLKIVLYLFIDQFKLKSNNHADNYVRAFSYFFHKIGIRIFNLQIFNF